MTTRVFGARQDERAYRVRPAAYAIIVDDERRVACVAEESGLFLPGGGLEPGEDAMQAVHREVAEECGRALEIIAPLEPATQFCITARGEAFELQASFFLARFGRELESPGQHELTWHRTSHSLPPFFHECHRWAVEEVLREYEANAGGLRR